MLRVTPWASAAALSMWLLVVLRPPPCTSSRFRVWHFAMSLHRAAAPTAHEVAVHV